MTIGVGDTVLAKLDDAPWKSATVEAIHPWGNGVRYMCRFPSGWVHGTTQVKLVIGTREGEPITDDTVGVRDGNVVTIDVMAPDDLWPDDNYAHVYVAGEGVEGDSILHAQWSRGTGVFTSPDHATQPALLRNTWRNLGRAIARHYKLSGWVEIAPEGAGTPCRFHVAYGDPRAASARA